VLKEYLQDDEPTREIFNNEVNLYCQLRGKTSSAHIATYYASLNQKGRRIIILEYAEAGTLADMFARDLPVADIRDEPELWASFFELLIGLYAIHNLTRSEQQNLGQWVLKG
jgi:hypothetical protein